MLVITLTSQRTYRFSRWNLLNEVSDYRNVPTKTVYVVKLMFVTIKSSVISLRVSTVLAGLVENTRVVWYRKAYYLCLREL